MTKIFGYWKFGYWLLFGEGRCLGFGDSIEVPRGMPYDEAD
jgi:hypothetical protein